MANDNPILPALHRALNKKRSSTAKTVTRNWLLALLVILDRLLDSDGPLEEDDIYSYDYTLKQSRAQAIVKLLERHQMPSQLGMSKEGVTTRGAPCLRFFREIEGGGVLSALDRESRSRAIHESIEILKGELLRTLSVAPVVLPRSVFRDSGTFVEALLDEVMNRSQGRVEQQLVGAKLQLRFPNTQIEFNPTFAGDGQTSREADFCVGRIRVIVSVAPKGSHFDCAARLAQEGRDVYLVVSEKSLSQTRSSLRARNIRSVTVLTVTDYVSSNMKEIAHERAVTPSEMCQYLVDEYNRRIAMDYDPSLRVEIPET